MIKYIVFLLCSLFILSILLVPERRLIINVGLLIIFMLGRIILRKQKIYSIYSLSAYLIFFSITALFVILNYHYFTLGNNYASPNLDRDALLYHNLAIKLLDKYTSISDLRINYFGYPIVLSLVYKLFGRDIIYGLLLNMLVMMNCLILSGKLAFQLLEKRIDKVRIAGYAMLFLCFIPIFIRPGCELNKDSYIILSVLLIMTNINETITQIASIKRLFYIAVGILILALFRPPYLLMVIVAILLIYQKRFLKHIVISMITLSIIISALIIGMRYSLYSDPISLIDSQVINNEVGKQINATSDSVVVRLIGANYRSHNFIQKAELLPVTFAIQWLLPIPFSNHPESIPRVPVFVFAHNMNILWYIVSYFIILYFFFVAKKEPNDLLKKGMFASLFLFSIPAFTEGGLTTRYIVPFIPMIVSGGAYSLYLIKCNVYFKNKSIKMIVILFLSIGIATGIYLAIK